MKKFLFGLLIMCSFISRAQVYNNEWIDYSKTYYKFKVVKNGVYRIAQSTLSNAGLGSANAQDFQLWHNGVQVPLFTSVASGPLNSSDYLEFIGEMNDGKADKELYRKPEFQLNDKWSLISDTAAYFLTVKAGANRRLQTTANSVAGTTLTPEPYFMHTEGIYYKSRINKGEAYNVVEFLYSSSFDDGEGWSSQDIVTTTTNGVTTYGVLTENLSGLFPYTGAAPAPKFKIALSGNSFNSRNYKVTINGDSIIKMLMPHMGYTYDSTNFAASLIASGNVQIKVTNLTECSNPPYCPTIDRMVVHKMEMTYARQFNLGGSTSFTFNLPANAAGNYLSIAGFNYGTIAPVLYDITNGKRYVADISTPSLVKVVLEPSPTTRTLVLLNEEAGNVNTVTSLEQRNFINYNTAATQGDYLIITNPLLFNGTTGNPVEEYRAYRSSIAGGGYNAKIYLIDELVDQFGFGIRKHPSAIRNFLRYTRNKYPQAPKFVFIIGKAVNYEAHRAVEIANNPTDIANMEKLNLVPTFGWPASDVLFTAEPGKWIAETPIGRLPAITPAEVSLYLKKIKEHELAQKTFSPVLADRNWMKNVVHIVGTSEPGLDAILFQYMENYKSVIQDTFYGAKVSTFRKTSTQTGEQLTSTDLTRLFNNGISLITYFGHSSSTTLDFNLDDPQNYSNQGKYPLFMGLGCNAGNFFNYNTLRLTQKETISEKYVFSPDRGTIGFISSTHFGIVHYLDIWNSRAYERITRTDYGKSIGEIMKHTIQDVNTFTGDDDFFARTNSEQTELNGDPAITINPHPKPDYIIEDAMVKISPSFISIADTTFDVHINMINNGKALDRNIVVQVKKQYPDGSFFVAHRETIQGIRYSDSLTVRVPINPIKDKGAIKVVVTVDADNNVDEMYETNNTVSKDVIIYEDDARIIYPSNFAIVNRQGIKLVASTANPLAESKQYRMEMDTTTAFNSAFKITRNLTSKGGVLEFDPGINFTDNTVYYWRVAQVPVSGSLNWNNASFVYLANSEVGYNQSHIYQHMQSTGDQVTMNPVSRKWEYGTVFQNLFVRTGTWVTSTTQEAGVGVAVNFDDYIRNACAFQSVVFNVFDAATFKPMTNKNSGSPASGMYGSWSICNPSRAWNFEYRYTDAVSRQKARDFMRDNIPDGAYVVVRTFALDPVTFPPASFPQFPQVFAADWKADQATYGVGNTLYDYIKNAGLTTIDDFNKPRQFVLVYKKNDPSFTPKIIWTDGTQDNKTLSIDLPTRDSVGHITSPTFGPAKAWKTLKWNGSSMENPSFDNPLVSVVGIKADGTSDVLRSDLDISQQVVDISSIDAATYPFLKLVMANTDSVGYTPYQLNYWRLTYTPIPEGAIAPNFVSSQIRESMEVAEPYNFKVAFKNVSDGRFDSLKVKMIITDRNNVQKIIPSFKVKPLVSMDSVIISYQIDTKQLVGANSLFVEVNPDNDQPEQYHFNNYIFNNFYVKGDTLSPIMDVTFDQVHILNNDVVSAKPDITIKLKDESKWFLLSDPSIVSVKIRYPDGTIRPFSFTSDTLKFTPAAGAPTGDNTATISFKPTFLVDGKYELIVTGKDMSSNTAGALEYKVSFQVLNKPMISNMLNYPNPFTTSTAFVFTITGKEIPQNIKIQVLTVTGKVVREITKDELGPLHIGRNITEFKWDGTDQYGQKLGNGVYLYRVVTNLNGKSLDKYTADGDETDKYFNKGYGKMYLMR